MTLHNRSRWPLAVLRRLLSARDADALVGDLVEEYELRSQSPAAGCAERWYWKQLARSVAPLLWARLRRGSWLITLGVALALYLAAGVAEFVGVAAVPKLLSTGPAGDDERKRPPSGTRSHFWSSLRRRR